MRVVHHPDVQKDVSSILRHYDQISLRLGDEFWAELMAFIERAALHPERCHPADSGRRRVNLRRFPYHFLFCLKPDCINRKPEGSVDLGDSKPFCVNVTPAAGEQHRQAKAQHFRRKRRFVG